MQPSMTKAQFLADLEAGRAEWEALLAEVPLESYTQPGAAGDWTLKDVIAHTTWHEREMVGMVEAHALVGSELWRLPLDERNAAIYEQNRNRPLEEVLAEAKATFPQLVMALQTLSDGDLNDPSYFPGMPAEWVPWQVIASNAHRHYQGHLPGLRDWLAQRKA
jgi:hypothetical protein